MRFIKPFRLRHRAIVDDEDVIEEHSSVAQLKATNEECTSVTLEECFQVAINYCLFQTSILIVFFFLALHASGAIGPWERVALSFL